MTLAYDPSKDELRLKIRSVKGRPNKKVNHFKLWWDAGGNICAINIANYTEVLKEFSKNLGLIQLGGIWKGIKVTEEDIREARHELLSKLEEKW